MEPCQASGHSPNVVARAAVYSRLLRSPGVLPLAGAFLALGMASTMTPVALVLFARAQSGSFATASLVVAASTAGGMIFGPARGRLVDRRGAREAVLRLVIPDLMAFWSDWRSLPARSPHPRRSDWPR